MKKFLFIFVIIFLASCGQNNVSQNNSSTNKENIQAEKMENMSSGKTENNSENISKNTESEDISKNEEVDYNEKYRQHQKDVIQEIIKLPEEKRTNKIGNFRFIFEEGGISIGYLNKKDDYSGWPFIEYSDFYTDSPYDSCYWGFYTYNNLPDNQETFEKAIKSEECSVTQENILKKIKIVNLENDFESLYASWSIGGGVYLFDKKGGYFVDGIPYVIKNIFRKWNKSFVYSASIHDPYYTSFLVFSDEYKVIELENREIDIEKSTFTEKRMELKDVNGEIIGIFNF